MDELGKYASSSIKTDKNVDETGKMTDSSTKSTKILDVCAAPAGFFC